MEYLTKHPAPSSFCEWKGSAHYYDISVGGRQSDKAAWAYANPTSSFVAIDGYIAFYAGRVEECYVGEERATPQPGAFYGGWVTAKIVGPFKGEAGSWGW